VVLGTVLGPAPQATNRGSPRFLSRFLASGPAADVYAYGIPIFTDVAASTPRYHVDCSEPWGTCGMSRQAVPIPPDAHPDTGSDASMVVIDPITGLRYEFWRAKHTAGGWSTSWGTISRSGGPGNVDIYGGHGTSGSGLTEATDVVTLSELASGRINHPLVFGSSITCSTFISPAVSSDGATPAPNCLPEGTRVKLDPSVDLAAIRGITPFELIVGRALQAHGAILRDTSGAPMSFMFQEPSAGLDPYPALGLPWDYWNMPHLPWNALSVAP
ncbi:MAG: hypothetical protein M3Y36_03625, partial [Actinomycetota bacterium]|nr:hypothetical protein [Actinomycetota bacterium]